MTVALPVFNGERYLPEALGSLLDQTYERFELVISDNCSSDATAEICQRHAAADRRIRYVRQPRNIGAAANFNALIDLARGELFRWAAHDDVVVQTHLESCVGALLEHPGGAVAFPGVRWIGPFGGDAARPKQTTRWRGSTPHERLEDLLHEPGSHLQYCDPIFGVMRTETLRGTRGIQPFESSDKVLLVELALRGDFIRAPGDLLRIRLHEDSSREAHASPEERLRWFNPSASGARPRKRTSVARGLARAIRDAPLSRAERAACYRVLGEWLIRSNEWRVILGELHGLGRLSG